MRKPFIAANWKMNTTKAEAISLAQGIKDLVGQLRDVDVGIAPPWVYLDAVANVLDGSNVLLGAQDLCAKPSGAFTGEISGLMIKDVGCGFIIVGHSERRHVFGEPDELVACKLAAVFAVGLMPILCIGETRDEREGGQTEDVVRRQLTSATSDLSREQAAQIVVAYEPVWAIGTGLTATIDQAQAVHKFIRNLLADLFDAELAQGTRIQYGGSVKPDNAYDLLTCEDIDGALVGGAALKVDSFVDIIRAGARAAKGEA